MAPPPVTVSGSNPVEVRQAAEDRSGLDLVRVQLARAADGRLRAVLTLAEDFDASDLRARRDGEVPGSLCLRMWTLTSPYGTPPDRLLCVSAPARGTRLVASLHQELVNADLRRIAILSPTRPSPRSVVVRFSQSAMGRPRQIRFAGEATTRACRRPACVDVLPAGPKVATLRLQSP